MPFGDLFVSTHEPTVDVVLAVLVKLLAFDEVLETQDDLATMVDKCMRNG